MYNFSIIYTITTKTLTAITDYFKFLLKELNFALNNSHFSRASTYVFSKAREFNEFKNIADVLIHKEVIST